MIKKICLVIGLLSQLNTFANSCASWLAIHAVNSQVFEGISRLEAPGLYIWPSVGPNPGQYKFSVQVQSNDPVEYAATNLVLNHDGTLHQCDAGPFHLVFPNFRNPMSLGEVTDRNSGRKENLWLMF